MTAGSIPIERRPAPPLPISARGAILIAVCALHMAALLLLLTEAGMVPAEEPERVLTTFEVAPDSPVEPEPEPEPKPEPDLHPAPVAAPPAPKPIPAGGGRPTSPATRATTFARVERQASFDATLVQTPAAPLFGAPTLGPPIDGTSGAGQIGKGVGTGAGSGVSDGMGGGGTRWRRARWIYRPTQRDIDRYFPTAARTAKVSGLVVLGCKVPRPGRPESCAIVGEAPLGMGFGDAAIRMSETFRIRPVRENDRHRDDVPVIVPVSFKTPGSPLPNLLACPPEWCFRIAGFKDDPAD